MKRLLREISVIPGVAGSCIYDKRAGALCIDFKAGLPVELTDSVGIHFVRLIQMGSMNKLNIKSVHFRFDKYSVVGVPLETGPILLAICESDANCSLVASTSAMLAADMGDELIVHSIETDGVESAAQDNDQPVSGGQQAGLASLKPQLDAIESALAAAIGPVASMVMSDYINKWSQDSPIEESRLGELIVMLGEEIGDKNLVRDFQAAIKHLQ